MERFINLRLMSNPANWVVLFLMVVIAYMGAGLIAQAVKKEQS